MMPYTCFSLRVLRTLHLYLQPEQGKIAVISHREIIRRHPVVIEQLLVQEIAVQRPFQLSGKIPRAPHPLRQNLLLEGSHLQMNQRTLPLQFIVAVPFLPPLQITFLVGVKKLLFRQFPQNLPILAAYFISHMTSGCFLMFCSLDMFHPV